MNPQSIGALQATTAAGSLALRTTVRAAIWGGPVTLPEMYQTSGGVEGAWATLLGRTPYYAEWEYWKWNAGGVPGALGMACRTGGVFFQNSSRLAIVCAGHNENMLPPQACQPDFDPLIKALAAAGCDLMLICMPWMGSNDGFHLYSDPALSGTQTDYYHWIIGTGAVQGNGLTGSRLRYWIDPVIAGMERAIACRDAVGQSLSTPRTYARIGVIGHSGGGWTTTLAAAMEPRITHSYAIAGSVPLGLQAPGEEYMDWEGREGVEALGVDYHDLYLMGAAEPTRKARLMHNGDDQVFKRDAVGHFAYTVKRIADTGGYGDLKILMDRDAHGHNISEANRNFIIAEFCA